jgi:hypothetical protein
MKNLFDEVPAAETLERIEQLTPHSQSQWGKMNSAQMLAHCSVVLDMARGITNQKREFLGLLIGRFVKSNYYNDKPFQKNLPTTATSRMNTERDFEAEKAKLRQDILAFQTGGPANCTTYPHPFLGSLTAEQWGKGMYKHLDHHLRQFGV